MGSYMITFKIECLLFYLILNVCCVVMVTLQRRYLYISACSFVVICFILVHFPDSNLSIYSATLT